MRGSRRTDAVEAARADPHVAKLGIGLVRRVEERVDLGVGERSGEGQHHALGPAALGEVVVGDGDAGARSTTGRDVGRLCTVLRRRHALPGPGEARSFDTEGDELAADDRGRRRQEPVDRRRIRPGAARGAEQPGGRSDGQAPRARTGRSHWERGLRVPSEEGRAGGTGLVGLDGAGGGTTRRAVVLGGRPVDESDRDAGGVEPVPIVDVLPAVRAIGGAVRADLLPGLPGDRAVRRPESPALVSAAGRGRRERARGRGLAVGTGVGRHLVDVLGESNPSSAARGRMEADMRAHESRWDHQVVIAADQHLAARSLEPCVQGHDSSPVRGEHDAAHREAILRGEQGDRAVVDAVDHDDHLEGGRSAVLAREGVEQGGQAPGAAIGRHDDAGDRGLVGHREAS